MEIAALIAWLITAGGGFVLLGTWLARGGARASRFPPALIFGHFLLAAIGLVVWIIYVINDSDGLAWAAFVILLPVALLGFAMFARWLGGRSAAGGTDATATPAEQSFPVVVVIAHGLLAVTTLVLVLLTALGAGN
jgi:hypothetical protein